MSAFFCPWAGLGLEMRLCHVLPDDNFLLLFSSSWPWQPHGLRLCRGENFLQVCAEFDHWPHHQTELTLDRLAAMVIILTRSTISILHVTFTNSIVVCRHTTQPLTTFTFLNWIFYIYIVTFIWQYSLFLHFLEIKRCLSTALIVVWPFLLLEIKLQFISDRKHSDRAANFFQLLQSQKITVTSHLTKVSAVPEGLVEPPVEEGVVAGGGHGEGVAREEGHVVPLPAVHAVVEIYPGSV